MLKDQKFDDVSRIIKEQQNVVMRNEYGQTFLMNAARYKRIDILRYLSDERHDLSIVDHDGNNVLHWIVSCNRDDVAFEMLKSLHFPQLNVDVINKQSNNYKQTPLHYAVRNNKYKSIVWLLGLGADPSSVER